jgi:hypothetical protein
MKREAHLQQPYLFFIAALLICLVVIGASAWSSRPGINKNIPAQQGDGKAIGRNKAEGLKVVSVEQTESEILLLMKNDYSKSINALTISIGDLTVNNDYVYSGKAIAPGSQYTFRIPKQPAVPGQSAQPAINILAVVFDDRTGDGEDRYVSKVLNSRLGEKIQLSRILPLLQKALKSSDADLPNAVDELVYQVSTLSESSDGQLSSDTQDASRGRKEFVLKNIQAIKGNSPNDNHVSLRKHLDQLKKHYEALISRL